jgi:hypothetical protein
LFQQKVEEVSNQRRFSHINGPGRTGQSPTSVGVPKRTAAETSSTHVSSPNQSSTDVDTVTVTFSGILSDGSMLHKRSRFNPSEPINRILQNLLTSNEISKIDKVQMQLIRKYPTPIQVINFDSSDSLDSLLENGVRSVTLGTIKIETDRPDIAVKASKSSSSSEKREKKKTPRGKKHTLFSMGILSDKQKKHNEYFGGDSTVVLGGDEDTAEESKSE